MTGFSINHHQASQAETYSIQKLSAKQSQATTLENIENNGKVDLIIADRTGIYQISGDNINISELGQAAPETALEVARFDLNKDGFLVEDELKHSKETLRFENEDRSRIDKYVYGFAGTALAGLGAFAIGGSILDSTTASVASKAFVKSPWAILAGTAIAGAVGTAGYLIGKSSDESAQNSVLERNQKQTDKIGTYRTSEWNVSNNHLKKSVTATDFTAKTRGASIGIISGSTTSGSAITRDISIASTLKIVR